MKVCPKCQRPLTPSRVSPSDLLAPPLDGPINGQVIEAVFLISCMIDVEITRLAATPADRDRLLALVAEHVEQRIESNDRLLKRIGAAT
jgi:hypothetical protein